jgi:hypothetical protein
MFSLKANVTREMKKRMLQKYGVQRSCSQGATKLAKLQVSLAVLLVVLSRLLEQIRWVISRSAPLKIAPHLACAFLACALQFASAASDDAFWSVGCNDVKGYGQLRVQWQKSVGLDREG